jgi:biotin carboxyl carrier protein
MTYEVTIDGKMHRVELLTHGPEARMRFRLDGRELNLDAVEAGRDVLSLLIDGRAWEVKRERVGSEMHLMIAGERYEAEVRDPRSFRGRKAAGAGLEGPKKLVSPMPGKVVRVLVAAGAEVEAGQGVIVVEAMKMQNEIKSPKKGTVSRIIATEGATVNAGEALAIVE